MIESPLQKSIPPMREKQKTMDVDALNEIKAVRHAMEILRAQRNLEITGAVTDVARYIDALNKIEIHSELAERYLNKYMEINNESNLELR